MWCCTHWWHQVRNRFSIVVLGNTVIVLIVATDSAVIFQYQMEATFFEEILLAQIQVQVKMSSSLLEVGIHSLSRLINLLLASNVARLFANFFCSRSGWTQRTFLSQSLKKFFTILAFVVSLLLALSSAG